jgi:hypothetical protein
MSSERWFSGEGCQGKTKVGQYEDRLGSCWVYGGFVVE